MNNITVSSESKQLAKSNQSSLPIALDAMGADLGSAVVVEGAVKASKELGLKTVIVGVETEIRDALKILGASNDPNLSVFHAPEVVGMHDSPSIAIRGKTQSSIRKSFDLVKDGFASAVVSPGNTGAVMAAGLYVCGALPGILRPAIASPLPRIVDFKPVIMLDAGANVDCHSYQLVQFALMGSEYAKAIKVSDEPRVGLLSNGSEMSKGTDLLRAAAQMISEIEEVNFIGYVEGKDIPRGNVDVVVTDGFLGNCVLKTMEGTAELVVESLKRSVKSSLIAQFGMFFAKPAFSRTVKQKLDPSVYGGAPLLGLKKNTIICHGSSNAIAIMNGIRVADELVRSNMVDILESALTELGIQNSGAVNK